LAELAGLPTADHDDEIISKATRPRIGTQASKGPFIATQLNSTRRPVELSCIAIDTLTDATQLSPAIGNELTQMQRIANQREAGQSS